MMRPRQAKQQDHKAKNANDIRSTALTLCNSESSFPDFPSGPVGGALPVSEGDVSSIPGLGRSLYHDNETPCPTTTELMGTKY